MFLNQKIVNLSRIFFQLKKLRKLETANLNLQNGFNDLCKEFYSSYIFKNRSKVDKIFMLFLIHFTN
jgi:hypothetical protein